MNTRTTSRRSRRPKKTASTNQDWDRRHLPGLQLHESEKLLVGVLTLLIVFLPWALGTSHVLSQSIAAFLAFVSLGTALLPRHGDTHSITSAGQFKRLATFPVFWIGLLLALYLVAQGVNTALTVEGTEGFRYLTESEPVSWLPAGVAAPFAESNPWRWLLILSVPFLTVCAAWVGLTRRKSIHLLLTALAINGFFIAAIAFYQIAKKKGLILWFYEPPSPAFLGPFPFHWQGAAYLTVVLAAATGMAAHHFARARKTFRRSNPSGLFLFVALAVMLMTVFSCSRPAAALAGGIVATFLAHVGYRELTAQAPLGRKVLLTFVAIAFVAGIGFFAGDTAGDYLDRKQRNSKTDLAVAPIAPPGTWSTTAEIGGTMFREKPLYGWGAGSFPHLYQEIAQRNEIEGPPTSLDQEYAVSDWIRVPAELGIAGSLLLLLTFGYLLRYFFHARTFQNPLVGFLLLGTLAGIVLSTASQSFQSVAFLTTWSMLLVFGAILIRVEGSARSRAETDLD